MLLSLLSLSFSLYPLFFLYIKREYWIFNFSTDSSIDLDCSLENDDPNYISHQSSSILQIPAQHVLGKTSSGNALDKPFGMDLSVEFGGNSNRSSIVSPQVRNSHLIGIFMLTIFFVFQDVKSDLHLHKS